MATCDCRARCELLPNLAQLFVHAGLLLFLVLAIPDVRDEDLLFHEMEVWILHNVLSKCRTTRPLLRTCNPRMLTSFAMIAYYPSSSKTTLWLDAHTQCHHQGAQWIRGLKNYDVMCSSPERALPCKDQAPRRSPSKACPRQWDVLPKKGRRGVGGKDLQILYGGLFWAVSTKRRLLPHQGVPGGV